MGFLFRHRLEVLVTLSCVALMGYFGMQATIGSHSDAHRKELAQHYAELEDRVAAITQERVALETRVSLMRPGNVDADLLDEMARRNLNLGQPNELVVQFSN